MSCTIRLDIDTWTGLTQGLEKWLELTDRLEIPSTIALSLGPYKTGRGNLSRIIDPKSPKSESKSLSPWKRTHWRDLLRGLLIPTRSALSERELIKSANRSGHELIPHGYDHTFWSHKFSRLSKEKTKTLLEKMNSEYYAILGIEPKACAAPAMQINPYYWLELEQLQFTYSSDIVGNEPFLSNSESIGKSSNKLVQLPITCSFMDNLLAKGYSNKAIAKYYVKEINSQVKQFNYSCWVIHANFEPMKYYAILNEIIEKLKADISFQTLFDQTKEFAKKEV